MITIQIPEIFLWAFVLMSAISAILTLWVILLKHNHLKILRKIESMQPRQRDMAPAAQFERAVARDRAGIKQRPHPTHGNRW